MMLLGIEHIHPYDDPVKHTDGWHSDFPLVYGLKQMLADEAPKGVLHLGIQSSKFQNQRTRHPCRTAGAGWPVRPHVGAAARGWGGGVVSPAYGERWRG